MDSVLIGGKKYVSVIRASELLGYSRDYVTQLCRDGGLLAKRISNQWFVDEESIKNRAVATEPSKNIKILENMGQGVLRGDSIFDNSVEYISSLRAAQITGYAQDYIGELARSGLLDTKKVGRQWFVSRKSLEAHKKEKDRLLAGVQSASSGFDPNKILVMEKPTQQVRYFTENNNSIELSEKKEVVQSGSAPKIDYSINELSEKVPIKVYLSSDSVDKIPNNEVIKCSDKSLFEGSTRIPSRAGEATNLEFLYKFKSTFFKKAIAMCAIILLFCISVFGLGYYYNSKVRTFFDNPSRTFDIENWFPGKTLKYKVKS